MPTGKARDRQLAVERPDAAVLQDASEDAVLQIVDEVADVDLRLQADEVVGGEPAGELAVLGDGEKRLPRRHRDVQEEADRVLDAELAQLHPQRDHVIVVHPDRVVGLQQRMQRAREAPVDLEIALVVAGFELRQIEAGVEYRPQHVVGVAEIVFLVLATAERQRGDRHRSGLDDVGGGALLLASLADLAAPAEPQAVARAQRVRDSDDHAARLRGFAEIADTIGDQYDPAHETTV